MNKVESFMQAAIEEVNSVQKRIKVSLTKEQVDSAFSTTFESLKRKVQLKGFRTGKAPMSMIRKFYGESARPDVLENLVRKNLFDAIQANNLRPVSQPVLETTDLPTEGKDYAFSALIDVMPDIKLGEYKGLNVRIPLIKIGEEEVNKQMEVLRRRSANSKSLDAGTTAAKGMLAVLSHYGKLEGVPNDALSAEKISVELGINELLPEMETALVGMTAGSDKTVNFTLPADYREPELAGKSVEMTLKMEELRELVLPTLDDEFAKDLGFDSIAALRERVGGDLNREAANIKRRQLEHSLLDQLIAKYGFEVPPSFVDQITDSMINEMQFSTDKERKEALHDQELRMKCRDIAKRRAQSTMILGDIARRESVAVTDEDIDNYVRNTYFPPGAQPEEKQVKEFSKMVAGRMKETLILDKAIQVMIDNAKIEEFIKS
jgi:trigger factor